MIDLEYDLTITPMFIQSVDQITFIRGLGYLFIYLFIFFFFGYHC